MLEDLMGGAKNTKLIFLSGAQRPDRGNGQKETDT